VDLSKVKDESELLIHHENNPDPSYAYLLTQMVHPKMPEPFGVFRNVQKPTYDEMMNNQVQDQIEKKGKGDLKSLIYGKNTWRVD